MRRALWSALALLLLYASPRAAEMHLMKWSFCSWFDRQLLATDIEFPYSPGILVFFRFVQRVISKKEITLCIRAKLRTDTLSVLLLEKGRAEVIPAEAIREKIPSGWLLGKTSFRYGNTPAVLLTARPVLLNKESRIFWLVQGVAVKIGGEEHTLTFGIRGGHGDKISPKEIEGYLVDLLQLSGIERKE